MSVFVQGDVARRLHTLGFPSAPSLRESLRQSSAHTTDHHYPIRCARRDWIPNPVLFQFVTENTHLCHNERWCQFRSCDTAKWYFRSTTSIIAVRCLRSLRTTKGSHKAFTLQPEQLLNHEPAQLGKPISEYHELTSPARMSPSPDHGEHYLKNHPLHTRRYHVPSQQPDHSC